MPIIYIMYRCWRIRAGAWRRANVGLAAWGQLETAAGLLLMVSAQLETDGLFQGLSVAADHGAAVDE